MLPIESCSGNQCAVFPIRAGIRHNAVVDSAFEAIVRLQGVKMVRAYFVQFFPFPVAVQLRIWFYDEIIRRWSMLLMCTVCMEAARYWQSENVASIF